MLTDRLMLMGVTHNTGETAVQKDTNQPHAWCPRDEPEETKEGQVMSLQRALGRRIRERLRNLGLGLGLGLEAKVAQGHIQELTAGRPLLLH